MQLQRKFKEIWRRKEKGNKRVESHLIFEEVKPDQSTCQNVDGTDLSFN